MKDIGANLNKRTPKSYSHLAAIFFIAGLVLIEIQGLNGQINLGNVLMVLFSITVITLQLASYKKNYSSFNMTWPDAIYLITLIMYLCSAYFSKSPSVTFAQCAYLSIMWMASLSINKVPPEVLARYFIRFCLIIAIISIVMIAVSPSIAFQPKSSTGVPELRGIMKHQLRLGLLMAIALCFIIIAFLNKQASVVVHRNPVVASFYAVVIAIVMMASMARSNIAFAIVALPLALGMSRPNWVRWLTVFCAIALIFIIIHFGDYFGSFIADDDGQIRLTGRTLIWERTTAVADEAPVFGHGFASFDTPVFNYMWNVYRPPHPHNSLISAYFENGVIGAFLLILLIIVQIGSVFNHARPRTYSYALLVIILSILASLTGVVYAGKPNILFGITLLFVSSESARRRGERFEVAQVKEQSAELGAQ